MQTRRTCSITGIAIVAVICLLTGCGDDATVKNNEEDHAAPNRQVEDQEAPEPIRPADTGTLHDAQLLELDLLQSLPVFYQPAQFEPSDPDTIYRNIEAQAPLLNAGGLPDDQRIASAQSVFDQVEYLSNGAPAFGFMDMIADHTRLMDPRTREIISTSMRAVDQLFRHHIEAQRYRQALSVALALHHFGYQLYEHNLNLGVRRQGLALMRNANTKLARLLAATREAGVEENVFWELAPEQFEDWQEAIHLIENAWQRKLRTIDTVNATNERPNIADLIRVAGEDENRSFRVFATLRLGYAWHERGEPDNRDAITATLQPLTQSTDPAIAAAAQAALSLIGDQNLYYELRQ